MCAVWDSGLHGKRQRVKAPSECSKWVVNSVSLSRNLPVFLGFFEIIRVVKDHKYIILYYRGGVIKERKTLQEVYQELDAEEFFYIDKGCIVNISHVCSCDRERVCLTGGTELHVSRSKYEMVRQKVLTYWGKVK